MCLAVAKKKFPVIDETVLYRSKYAATDLKEALREVYGNRTIGDIKTCRVVIPAVNLVTGKPVTFKTPHQPHFIRDRHFYAVDVALATAAAPTYFPQATVQPGSSYTDGGLWANNPSIVAFAEAMKIREACNRPEIDPVFEPQDVFMLSIGTGEPKYYAQPGPTDDGLLWWAPQLFDVAGGAQSQGTHAQARYLMGDDRYIRIDFKMPSVPWKLDDVNALPQLFLYGDEAAVESYPRLKESFFSVPTPEYHPFNH